MRPSCLAFGLFLYVVIFFSLQCVFVFVFAEYTGTGQETAWMEVQGLFKYGGPFGL